MVEFQEKNNGIYYTPPQLTIQNPKVTILDPAFGQGALLLAARERLIVLGREKPTGQLFGYDIQPLCKKYQKTHFKGLLDEKKIIEGDFFSLDKDFDQKKFDIILMNPPFVRHHKLDKTQLQNIRKSIGDTNILQNTSDLWAYFIIYSLNFIEDNGSLAAILPWAFIQADYARIVRRILYDKFEKLNVVIIGRQMFDKTQERVLVFCGENFGLSTKTINLYYSFDVPKEKILFNCISQKAWIENPLEQLSSQNTQNYLDNITNRINYQPLQSFATIRIGTVTGANSFFILDDEAIGRINPPKNLLRPIIKHSNELQGLCIENGQKCNNYLLIINQDSDINDGLKSYIEIGISKGLHLGYHAKKRNPWYSIRDPIPPDGFLPYMSKEIPYITFNTAKLLSTNSVHQIFFSGKTDDNARKWIQFSMFSSISQLSIELYSKTYGGGVLKIEPSAAKNILVYSGEGKPFPKELGEKVNKILAQGNKRKVVEFVDDWVINNLRISKKDMELAKKMYKMNRDLRLKIREKSV